MTWNDVALSLRGFLNEAAVRKVTVVVRGTDYACWKCETTNHVPLVVHLDELTRHDDCFPIDAEPVLPYITELLAAVGHPAASTVKHRYSRSAGHRYLSLGCIACDSLFGMFPLSEEYLHYAVEDRIGDLPVMAQLDRPALEWWTLEGVRSNLLSYARAD